MSVIGFFGLVDRRAVTSECGGVVQVAEVVSLGALCNSRYTPHMCRYVSTHERMYIGIVMGQRNYCCSYVLTLACFDSLACSYTLQ